MLIPRQLRMLIRRLFRRTTGERSLRLAYERHYGKSLDCDDAQTFSQKVFQRMIFLDRSGDRAFTDLTDKYLVRDYVSKRIGEKYLVKLIWQGQDPRKIPFDTLPEKCVIKTNHGSGGHLFVKGDVDRARVIDHFRKALKENYYWRAREFQYFNIVPRIMIEELLDDGEPMGPLDFRCWCFNGAVELIQVDNRSYSINPFYDRPWQRLDLSHREGDYPLAEIPKPGNLDELLSVAETLSAGFDFVRVDLYNIRGRIYFGELTFTPRAGIYSFKPESWDAALGAKWRQGEVSRQADVPGSGVRGIF